MRALVLFAAALALGGCQRLSDEESIALVVRYNARNVEAFRAGDARLTEETTGLEEGKKLLGLIGVRMDQGTVLDAQLLSFDVTGVVRERDRVQVTARERWRWVVRRVGTGQPLGAASDDAYVMRYTLGREQERWVVLKTEHAEPPVVGRPAPEWRAPVRDLHGLPARPPAGGGPTP